MAIKQLTEEQDAWLLETLVNSVIENVHYTDTELNDLFEKEFGERMDDDALAATRASMADQIQLNIEEENELDKLSRIPKPDVPDNEMRANQRALQSANVNLRSFTREEWIDPKFLMSPQRSITQVGFDHYLANTPDEAIKVVRFRGRLIIEDGNHRANAMLIQGRKIRAEVIDLDKALKQLSPEQLPNGRVTPFRDIFGNEQLIDQLLEHGPRPAVEQTEIERIERDDAKRLREVAEEERLGRTPDLRVENPAPAVRKKDKDLTAPEALRKSEFERAARIAGRQAFLAGATEAGVEGAAAAAVASAALGLSARQQVELGIVAIPAAVVFLFFGPHTKKEQTRNEELQEDFIRHQIYVLRFASGLQSTVVDLLNGSEKQLKELLERRVGPFAGKPYDRETERRLKLLMKQVHKMRERVMGRAEEHWLKELRKFSVLEGKYVQNAAGAISPLELKIHGPRESTFMALVDTSPFEGRVMRDHLREFRRKDLERIEASIRAGMVNGETTQQITARVLGTTRARGRDGQTQITRNHAETLVRTSVNTIANQAREEMFVANKDVFEKERYVATLDARTTPICRALDGKTYDIGKGPVPPQHFNCRSLRVALIGQDLVGKRPMKPVTEQRLLREYARDNGLSGIRTRADLPRGTRGQFDAFAQRRTREMIGRVPARVNYQEFLSGRPTWFQNDVLGAQRAALFRRGGLTLEKFVDRRGRQYTLAELARRERDAFLRAGLDPDEYR